MIRLSVFNETNKEIADIKKLKEILKKGLKHLKIKDVEFNIIFVDNNKIHELNREYRHVDRVTDVITFALEDDDTFNPVERVLGDVYISIDKAISQANEYKHSLTREVCFLGLHGMLHLLGYDHMTVEDEKIMFELQDEILDEGEVTK